MSLRRAAGPLLLAAVALLATFTPDAHAQDRRCAPPYAGAGPDYRGLEALKTALVEERETLTRRVRRLRQRIARLDDHCFDLNSVTDWNPEALALARAADQSRRDEPTVLDHQPLHGVPILLKASIDTGDSMPTHVGAQALAQRRAADDAALVLALRAAGALIVGKANLSEWANFRSQRSVSGWSGVGGQTRNPHVLDRNPCGSSSGSAVAVAAGLVPVAIGTETNGSIVCPAGVNGVVGYKPTQGRVPIDGIAPIAASFDTAGPLARSVRDAARVGSVLLADGEDLERGLGADALEGRRIAVWRAHYGSGSDPRLDAILSNALMALRGAGAILIDPFDFELDSAVSEQSYAVLLHEFQAGLATYLAEPDDHNGPDTLAAIVAYNEARAAETMPWFGQDILERSLESGALAPAEYLAALEGSRDALRKALEVARSEQPFDAILALTNAPAWPIDSISGDRFSLSSSTLAAVSGWPTVSLPAGAVRSLPVGVSLTAPADQDAALLAMAYALEQRLPPAPRPTFRSSLEDPRSLER